MSYLLGTLLAVVALSVGHRRVTYRFWLHNESIVTDNFMKALLAVSRGRLSSCPTLNKYTQTVRASAPDTIDLGLYYEPFIKLEPTAFLAELRQLTAKQRLDYYKKIIRAAKRLESAGIVSYVGLQTLVHEDRPFGRVLIAPLPRCFIRMADIDRQRPFFLEPKFRYTIAVRDADGALPFTNVIGVAAFLLDLEFYALAEAPLPFDSIKSYRLLEYTKTKSVYKITAIKESISPSERKAFVRLRNPSNIYNVLLAYVESAGESLGTFDSLQDAFRRLSAEDSDRSYLSSYIDARLIGRWSPTPTNRRKRVNKKAIESTQKRRELTDSTEQLQRLSQQENELRFVFDEAERANAFKESGSLPKTEEKHRSDSIKAKEEELELAEARAKRTFGGRRSLKPISEETDEDSLEVI